MSFPQDESSFPQNSPQNSISSGSFVNFPSKNNELIFKDIEKEDQDRYFVNERQKIKLENENKIINKKNYHPGSSKSPNCLNTPKIYFKTSKIFFKCSSKELTGRKRKKSIINKNAKNTHSKYYEDNVTAKIQIHAMNSMIQYVNEIISKIDLGLENIPVFKKIYYSFKRKINTTTFEENKKITIENLIEAEISPKYKTLQSDYNKKELEKIKKNEVIKNILSQKYIDYFKEVYYKNERIIDLSKYGLKKIINLSNRVKLYEDIFKEKDDDDYRNRIEEIIKKKFLI